METKRPVGVTIIGILVLISGIILFFAGIGLVALAPLISQVNIENNNTSNSSISININGTDVTIPNNALFILGGFMGVVGGILIVLGIASFVAAWSLFTGKGWAWIVTIIITILSIILNIILIIFGTFESVIGLIINGIIIYYLYRPSVKSYYGRVEGPTV